MPIHVKININDHEIEELHIGRIAGGTNPDDINTYLAVLGSEPLRIEDWKNLGTEFTHRYGDMVLVCVQKALSALTKKDQPGSDSESKLSGDGYMTIEYTYPDGLGSGGTFTDGDVFTRESVQTIIDEVVAKTRADENKRINKLLKKNLKTAQGLISYSVDAARTESYLHGLEQSIALIKESKK